MFCNFGISDFNCIMLQEMLLTRCSPWRFIRKLRQLNSVEHHRAIVEVGMGELIEIKGFKLCKKLILHVVDNFDVVTSSMKIGEQVKIIGVEDVVDILGLPSSGASVSESKTEEKLAWMKFGMNGSKGLKLTALEAELDAASPRTIEFKGKFILYAVGCLLCPNSKTSVDTKYLRWLTEDVTCGKVNWAKEVYEYLIRSIALYKSAGSGAWLCGCVMILQVL